MIVSLIIIVFLLVLAWINSLLLAFPSVLIILIITLKPMSKQTNPEHWINRESDDLNFPIDEELFKALHHRPKRGKDLSNLTFNRYVNQMYKEEPIKAMDLCLKLQSLRVSKQHDDLNDQLLVDDRFTLRQRLELISSVFSWLGRKDERPLPRQKITNEVADRVRELAQATNDTSLISRLCKISRGSVRKILKNGPK